MDFKIAVKAFVIENNKLLVIKRRPNDVHKPGQWDIPGGRLELGENPMEGLVRESMEEIGVPITPIMPIDVHHFVREDKQKITMIIFLCSMPNNEIKLSEEHTEYKWVDLRTEVEQLPEWLKEPVHKFLTHVKI
jgi:8-oxo-dGTP diphosphatase